jgi:hypothetical protein
MCWVERRGEVGRDEKGVYEDRVPEEVRIKRCSKEGREKRDLSQGMLR